jgi:hypothetical protein
MNLKERIESAVDEITSILEKHEKGAVLRNFYYFKKMFKYAELIDIQYEIQKIYGGMGSVNDLVLDKDGKMLIEENRQLSKLKNILFRLITDH